MVDRRTLRSTVAEKLELEGREHRRAPLRLPTELIIIKDVDSLLFKEFEVTSSAGTARP